MRLEVFVLYRKRQRGGGPDLFDQTNLICLTKGNELSETMGDFAEREVEHAAGG